MGCSLTLLANSFFVDTDFSCSAQHCACVAVLRTSPRGVLNLVPLVLLQACTVPLVMLQACTVPPNATSLYCTACTVPSVLGTVRFSPSTARNRPIQSGYREVQTGYSQKQPGTAMVQPGPAWYSPVQPGTVRYSPVQSGTARYSLVQSGYSKVQPRYCLMPPGAAREQHGTS